MVFKAGTGGEGKAVLTFIPARDSMFFNLNWPDWTEMVYSNVSLN